MRHVSLSLVFTISPIILAITTLPNIAIAQESYSNDAYDNNNISVLSSSPMQSGAFDNTGLKLPYVIFLSNQSEIDLFYKIYGFMNFAIGNSSMGIPDNIQASQVHSTIYVAWQSNIAGKNHVFLSISYNAGHSFTMPVELTPPNAGNATSLQLKAAGPLVSLIWQNDDNVTGISNIYGALSFDMGSHLVVNKLSAGNTNATEPVLSSPVFAFWKQVVDPNNSGDPCGGGGPGPGPYPDQSFSGSVGNSTSLASFDPEEPPIVLCAHWW
jgi:hypothetical protein